MYFFYIYLAKLIDMKIFTFILLFFLISTNGSSQERLTNFFNPDIDKSSNPSDFIKLNDKLIFVAENDNFGAELWVSDGTSNSASLLKDINSGPSSGIAFVYSEFTKSRRFSEHTAILNNELYFIAQDGIGNGNLWKTDGTTQGTQKITNSVNFNFNFTNPQQSNIKLTTVNNEIFFHIVTENGIQFWKTDGTNSGTILVKDNVQVSEFGQDQYRGSLNNLYIFGSRTLNSDKIELWRSDGTESGTFQLISNIDGNGSNGGTQGLNQLIEFDSELYFVARGDIFSEPRTRIGIVKTDGSIANTMGIQNLYTANELFDFSNVIEINNNLYFSFYRFSTRELDIWKYDPVLGVANIIYSVNEGFQFMTSNLAADEANLIFTGPSQNNKTALLQLNTLNNEVQEIKELSDETPVGFYSSTHFPNRIQRLNDNEFYIKQTVDGNFSNGFTQGWITNISSEGTIAVNALNNLIRAFTFNNSLFFPRIEQNLGNELWFSDGTDSGTTIYQNLNTFPLGIEPSASTEFLKIKNISATNDNVIFGATDPSNGFEPRAVNGTTEATELLLDVNPGIENSDPGILSGYVNYNGEVYFSATQAGFATQKVFKTDGTSSGTSLLPGLPNGSSSQITNFIEMNGVLYFTGRIGNIHYLFSTDGSNISVVKNFGSGTNTFDMISSGDKLYLYNPTFSGPQIWVSDGTESGTILLKTFITYGGFLTASNNKVYFSAKEIFEDELELWQTDGTVSGTIELINIGAGYDSAPQNIVSLGDNIIFSAFTIEEGRELWISDGTPTGTTLLKDINNSPLPSLPNNTGIKTSSILSMDDYALFAASDGVNDTELWITDGTTNGTTILKNINSELSSNPGKFVKIGDKAYFQATSQNEGTELWVSDGTENGTLLISDTINPGINGSNPQDMIAVDNDLVFTATSTSSGRQIYILRNQLLSVVDLSGNVSTELFPNPTSEYVNINSELAIESAKIFDINGKLIKKIDKIESQRIDVSDLLSGIYILSLETDGRAISKKLIIN